MIRTVSRGAHYEAGFDKDKKIECGKADNDDLQIMRDAGLRLVTLTNSAPTAV
jgi:hypothetical protein